jgi:hypothetical protein
MGNGEVIKSFLVGLGFNVDESSLAAFNKSIATAALRVTALYGAVNAFAGSMVYAFSKISDEFEQLGYQYHIIAPAINKAIVLRNEMLKAYGAAGINIRKVIVDSINLNMSLAKTKLAMEAIYKSVGSKFFGQLQKQSDMFRKKLYENMPYIINALTKLVKGVFEAFDMVTQLGGRVFSILSRVYDFFVDLDKATNGWSTYILGAIAAWKLLNLEFLATPLGMILTLGLAILELYDDFKTFKEGGQSLINWGSDFTKMVVGLVGGIGAIAAVVYGAAKAMEVWSAITKVLAAVEAAFNGVLSVTAILEAAISAPIWLIVAAIGALVAGLTLADEKWKIFGGHLSGFFSGIGGKVLDFIGGASNMTAKIQNGGAPSAPIANPLGSSTQNTNVIAKMQTDINVTASPNADATARAIGGQQQAVNRDFTRNLKGATR